MDSISPDSSGSDTESTTSILAPQNHSTQPLTFPLAHPPPKPSQCLRLAPKLLLQIQHLSPKSPRPLPVLEVWQPSRFAARPCANLPKLRAQDMYITQSEAYTSLSGAAADSPASDSDASQEAVVGVIYHAQKTKPKKEEPGQAGGEVHFLLGGRVWAASAVSGGGYRFQGQDGEGGNQHVLEWRKRGAGSSGREKRSISFSSSSTDPAPGENGLGAGAGARFVLGIVDAKTRRGARVASLTKRGFQVGCWERLPRDALRECVGVGVGVDSSTEPELSEAQLRTAVYTIILTMGVWVASQEGWLG